jgi:hypothetical protein
MRFSAVSQSPNKLRVELFTTGFPKLLTLLIVDEPDVVVYDSVEKVYYGSNDSAKAIGSVLGVPYNSQDLLLWSLGRIPSFSNQNGSADLLVDRDFARSKIFALSFNNSGGRWRSLGRIDFCDSTGSRVGSAHQLESIFLVHGKADFSSRFSYDESPCIEKPAEISFTIRKHRVAGVLSEIKAEINPDLSKTADKLFNLEEFVGSEIVPLDHYKTQYEQNDNRDTGS